MKKLLVALVLLMSVNTMADESAEIAKAAGTAFLKTFATDYVRKKLDEQLANTVCKGAASKILAAYSIYSGAMDLKNAKSDSQKFYATAEIAAGVITMVAAPVGAIVSLCVVGAELEGAALDSVYQKKFDDMKNEILDIEKQTADIQQAEVKAELDYYMQMQAAIEVLSLESKDLVEQQTKQCTDMEKLTSPMLIQNCYDLIVRKTYVAEMYADILTQMMNRPSFFVSFNIYASKVLNLSDDQIKTFRESVSVAGDARAQLNEVSKAFSKFQIDLADQIMKEDPEIVSAKLKNQCIQELSDTAKNILVDQKRWEQLVFQKDSEALQHYAEIVLNHVSDFETVDLPLCQKIDGISENVTYKNAMSTINSFKKEVGVDNL